jgi:hypothetical protein
MLCIKELFKFVHGMSYLSVCFCCVWGFLTSFFRRKNWLLNVGYVGWRAVEGKQFLICAPFTFLKRFWPKLHGSFFFVIKCSGAYCRDSSFRLQKCYPNYGPIFFSSYRIYSKQFLLCATATFPKRILFVQTSTEALSSGALAHIVGVLWLYSFWPHLERNFALKC